MPHKPIHRGYYVEVRRYMKRRWVLTDKDGPMAHAEARALVMQLRSEVSKDVSHLWRVRAIPDRRDYFAAYHSNKYATDPDYVAKKRASALAWKRRQRAVLRGEDVLP